ncbi:MAG TPA: extracellular solute-binding protein, partial [Yinghuangia sp.]|nr:extracellular solute-binding protein [Yinghuangia sp.]
GEATRGSGPAGAYASETGHGSGRRRRRSADDRTTARPFVPPPASAPDSSAADAGPGRSRTSAAGPGAAEDESTPGSAFRSGPGPAPDAPTDGPERGTVERQIVEAELVDDDAPLPPRASAAAAPGETDLPGRPAAPVPGAAPPHAAGPASTPPHPSEPPADEPPRSGQPGPAGPSARIIRSGAERRRFLRWVAAGGAVLAGAVTGAVLWGSGGSGKSKRTDPGSAPAPAGNTPPGRIRAWLRDGTWNARQIALLSDELPAALGTSVKYDVELRSQQALGQELVNAFNREDVIPDVYEVDLLSLAGHVAAGRIANLTDYQDRFETDTWLPTVRSAVTIQGAVSGLPMTASVPVVLCHRGMYAAAGVPLPRSREEWVDGLEHLRTHFAPNPAFRSVYLPGRAWPVLASFMWEAGGAIAFPEGHNLDDPWRGAFDLPGSADAVRFFRQLQQYAPEVSDATEAALRPDELFTRGQTASVIGSEALYTAVTSAAPALAAQLDAFPLPGRTPDRPGAVGLGGTALVVSSTCRDIPAAVDLLTTLTSARWRSQLAQSGRVLSPYAPDEAAQGANPMLRAGAGALAGARAYPAAPGWSERPLVEFGRAVLGGTDAMAAAVASNQIVASEFGRTTG